MRLRADYIHCLECCNMPCPCLQLCIKVFTVRRNGAGCRVLSAVSATMGKRGPRPAANVRGRKLRGWQLVFPGRPTVTETFLETVQEVECVGQSAYCAGQPRAGGQG